MAFFKPWGQNEDSLTNQLLQLSQWYTGQMDKQKTSINADLQGAGGIIDSSMTEEQLVNARRALDNLKGKSSDFGETSFKHQAMSNALENRQYAYNEYKGALEQYGDYMNSDMHLTKAEDWQDLDSLLVKKREAGENYDSVADMMAQEYARLGMLSGKIAGGREAGFYFKGSVGGGNYSENDVNESLGLYGKRLDSGMEALMGDGTISIDEAELIMSGVDRAGFKEYRNRKLVEVKDLINDSKSEITSLQNIQRRLLEGSLKDSTDAEMDFLQQAADSDTTGFLQNALNRGDTDALKKELQNYIDDAQLRLNTSYGNYKNWSGSAYGDVYSGSDEINTFDDNGEVIEEDWMEQGDKELKEREDKELIEKYGTADRKEIKAIIEREIEEGKLLNIENIEKFGSENILSKVNKGELSQDAFKEYISKADIGVGANNVMSLFKKRPGMDSSWMDYFDSGEIPQYPGVKYDKMKKLYDRFQNNFNEWMNIDKEIAGSSLKSYLSGDLAMMQAINKATPKEIEGQKVKRTSPTYSDQNKLNDFKTKFKNSGMSIEDFIAKNQEEFRNIAITLKYSKTLWPTGMSR